MALDIVQIRKETPGCHDKTFLNSAGASLMPKPVIDIMHEYLEYETMVGGYQAVPKYQTAVQKFYEATAQLIGCHTNNIAYCYNATDAFGKAVTSIPFQQGDIILTTDDDYISNHFLFISLQNRFGINIVRGVNSPNGDLDLKDFESKMKELKPALVSVTHIPTNTGKVQPVAEIGQLCSKYNIIYIVDACQSVGQIDVNVHEIKCDFLSATGRKFLRGPRGTGFLYVSDKMLHLNYHPLLLDMRGAIWTEDNEYKLEQNATRYELWESNYGNLIGLGQAIDYAQNIGLANIHAYNNSLCSHLKHGLNGCKDLIITENGSKSAGIITFTSKTMSQEIIEAKLKEALISYSVGYRHFALIDFNKKDVDWVVRLSPHYFNTISEMEYVADVLCR
ncbi:MAG: aminotransferase class V-fold PLP-dependent enzyme [Saprospiraceae bacterium]